MLWVGVCGAHAWAQKPKPPVNNAPRQAPSDPERTADRAALKALVEQFVSAFSSGDAEATAALLTEGAELIPEQGDAVRGKQAIQELYAAHFQDRNSPRIELEPESVRFISQNSAIEEGHMRISTEGGAPAAQRYGLMFVRENGNWQIALIREWASEQAGLLDLEWLVGHWEAKRPDAEVHTTYEWFGDHAFLKGTISARQKDVTLEGMQLIGLDPVDGSLRIWVFEADGGFAQGVVTREDDSWIFETIGTLADGGVLSSKNILVRVNDDTITWQPVQLTVGDEQIADLPPVKVTRIKPAK
jgi:uncharacterized protein (TIGR02246 family)